MAATSTTMSGQQTAPIRTPASTRTKRKRNADYDETEAGTAPAKYARRRESNHATGTSSSIEVIDLTGDSPTTSPTKKTRSPRKLKQSPGGPTPERRARTFRKHAPKSIQDRLERARTQPMYVVGHTVEIIDDVPQMMFDVVGSTGNIYKTIIGKVPTCNCPDARKGNQCKHILYVLVNALKAPEHLQYQLAFLSSELREIYEQSPLSRQMTDTEENSNGNRKPIEGDCPICFMEFEPDKEEIVWCRAACGNNIHKVCFQKWANTQSAQGVRCVYCRSPWETDASSLSLEQLTKRGHYSEEGYVNVADQLGMSGERDSSTYYQYWGSRGSSSSGWARRGRWYGSYDRDYYNL